MSRRVINNPESELVIVGEGIGAQTARLESGDEQKNPEGMQLFVSVEVKQIGMREIDLVLSGWNVAGATREPGVRSDGRS